MNSRIIDNAICLEKMKKQETIKCSEIKESRKAKAR